jgi:hypothetical protein
MNLAAAGDTEGWRQDPGPLDSCDPGSCGAIAYINNRDLSWLDAAGFTSQGRKTAMIVGQTAVHPVAKQDAGRGG